MSGGDIGVDVRSGIDLCPVESSRASSYNSSVPIDVIVVRVALDSERPMLLGRPTFTGAFRIWASILSDFSSGTGGM